MNVWEEIIRVAAANGIWAMLFVALLIYQLQDSRKREAKYQDIIACLTKSVQSIEDVQKDVQIIREITIKGDKRCKPNRNEVISYES